MAAERAGAPPAPEFSRRVPLAEIDRAPRPRRIAATPAECAALARRFGIEALSGLRAEARLAETAPGVVLAEGIVEAEVSVVGDPAEDPVDFTVSEGFEEVFATPRGWKALAAAAPDGEVDAEPVSGGAIDLGEVAAQVLSLALDPVLLEAAAFDDGVPAFSAGGGADEAAGGPFAALAALRRRGASGDGPE